MKFADIQGIFMYMQIDDKYATNKMHIPLCYVWSRILDLRFKILDFSYFVLLGTCLLK